MSSIDAVIARSRMQGGFSERKRFSVARREGIEKMRKFALADPHQYALELVQAAIANGANSVDIAVTETSATLAYVGGGLAESELGQLFDFLFASKDRADIAHVRALAVGLNAALLFKPERIVVESGDGTLAGSTRMVLHGDQSEVEVGRPDAPISGTYISIQRMNRRAAEGSWFSSFSAELPKEFQIIEERCLAAPIPIVFGGRPLFGWSSQRCPALFGYKKVLAFDEGELYGTIGVDPTFSTPDFRLLTWGVAIQSRAHDLVPGRRLGGVVCFDRLRKTVDHSAIVDDERLAELWARLKPYAQQLIRGDESASPYGATLLGETDVLTPIQLRGLARDASLLVVAPPGTALDSPEGVRAKAIGHALSAPVVCVDETQLSALPLLAGADLGIIRPWLGDDLDRRVYTSAPPEAPPRPWLASPVEAPPLSTSALAALITGEDEEYAVTIALADTIGNRDVRATVYTPAEHSGDDAGVTVEVRTSDRRVWRGHIPSQYAGSVLIIDLPHTRPSVLRAPAPVQHNSAGETPLVAALAHAVTQHAAGTLALAFERAVSELERNPDINPGSPAASLGLVAAARSSVARLTSGSSGPAWKLAALTKTRSPALGLPLLTADDGSRWSLDAVVAQARQGLVYGTIAEVPADLRGLDRSKVLVLTDRDERTLIDLIGNAAYVRVDARDVLARYRGVEVRDIAVGLRAYPDFPLLVEGEDPSAWPKNRRHECLTGLLERLIDRFAGVQPPRPSDPLAYAGWEECRRHACRHLQWAAIRLGDEAPQRLATLPLFLDDEDRAMSWAAVRDALQGGRVQMLYRPLLGDNELGQLASAGLREAGAAPLQPTAPCSALAASPFVYALLGEREGAPDEAQAERRGLAESEFLVSIDISEAGFTGHVGVPRTPGLGSVTLVLPDGQRRPAARLVAVHGIAGVVAITTPSWTPAVQQALSSVLVAARRSAHQALLERVRETSADDPLHNRMLAALLEFGASNLALRARPDGVIEYTQHDALAHEVFGLAVFRSRSGGHVHAWRLIKRFAALAVHERDPTAAVLNDLDPQMPSEFRRWVTTHLHPARIFRPAARPATIALPPEPAGGIPRPRNTEIAHRVSHWLNALRPDALEPVAAVVYYEGTNGACVDGHTKEITLNADHWLFQWAAQHDPADPRAIAWLMLAVYAYLNEMSEDVTNTHELAFQVSVADALASGQLSS